MSLKADLWQAVVRAIETAIPEYDVVNERVSLGQAMKARRYAADQLEPTALKTVLDAGIGPGTMSEALLSKENNLTIVGFDASVKLLQAARQRLRRLNFDHFHTVCGVFEALPFRDGCLQRIVSAYAFRDARDRDTAIAEFARISADDSVFAIVDLGKPDKALKRLPITIYVRFLMPLIAWWSKSKVKGNPWRMIFPTYQAVATNGILVSALQKCFATVNVREWSLGAVIVVVAEAQLIQGLAETNSAILVIPFSIRPSGSLTNVNRI